MIRDELRRLHEQAGKPTADNLKEHADRRGHSVGRATLWAVLTGTGGLRWATVEAFVDACDNYAGSRRRPLPRDVVNMLTWRTRFDRTYPPERSARAQPLPRRVGLVPRLADYFQTRALDGDLSQAAAAGGGTAVLTGTATRLLSGMGGVGKTQLAVHLAEQLWQDNQLDLLVWIDAASRQAIIAGYARAAVDTGAAGVDTEQDAARFHAWLASTDQRWLVVLDDLTRVADLNQLWPPTRLSGRTVVTTRLRAAALTGPARYLVPVGVFNPEEAANYLQQRLADYLGLVDDVDGVTNDLGHLPLALSQAAAFMIDEAVPCSEYRRRFADRRQRFDGLAPASDQLPDDYDRTVAATVALSVEIADRSRPTGLATPLLQLASVFDPAGIPTSVFTTTAAHNWLAYANVSRTDGASAGMVDVDIDIVRSGLRALHRLNLITIDNENVAVHSLVQRTARDQLSEEHIADIAWAAADALAEAWPPVERDTSAAQIFRANAAIVYWHGRDALLAPGAHRMLARANRSLGEAGNPARAAQAYEELLTDCLRVLGPDHHYTLATRGHVAEWRGAAGDAAGAVQAYEELLTEMLQALGPDHTFTLTTRGNLASWRGKAGDQSGAVQACEELLTDCRRVLGPDDSETLTVRNNLARLRGLAGDPAGAAQAMEDLLTDRLRVLGPDHPDVFATRHNVAGLRGLVGDAAGAVVAYEELLTDMLHVFARDHLETLTTRGNLAHWRVGRRCGTCRSRHTRSCSPTCCECSPGTTPKPSPHAATSPIGGVRPAMRPVP